MMLVAEACNPSYLGLGGLQFQASLGKKINETTS
jgi:hypothetical protein